MKNFIFAVLATALFSGASFAQEQEFYGSFTAPNSPGLPSYKQEGDIIFDTNAGVFKGFKGGSTWDTFGNVTAATVSQTGTVLLPNAQIRLTGGNGHGSTNTKIRRFTNTAENTGTGLTITDSSTLGTYITVNEAGIYSISYSDGHSTGTERFGITVNSSALTTGIDGAGNDSFRRVASVSPTGNFESACSVTLRLAAGDVIRAHTQGNANLTSVAQVILTVTQVAKL